MTNEHFCHVHKVNYLKKTCLEFENVINHILNEVQTPSIEKEDAKAKKEELSLTMLL